MHQRICTISFSFLINLFISAHLQAQQPAALEFKTQQIDSGLGVGYAVVAADLDRDGRTDLVVADKSKILWYHNPDWKRRVLLEGQTKPDNVCLAAHDIDGMVISTWPWVPTGNLSTPHRAEPSSGSKTLEKPPASGRFTPSRKNPPCTASAFWICREMESLNWSLCP